MIDQLIFEEWVHCY